MKGQGTRCNTCSQELQTTRERGNVKNGIEVLFFYCLATGRLISQGGKDVYNFLSSSPCFDNRNGNEGMISVLVFLL
jgi:hypothetical protein